MDSVSDLQAGKRVLVNVEGVFNGGMIVAFNTPEGSEFRGALLQTSSSCSTCGYVFMCVCVYHYILVMLQHQCTCISALGFPLTVFLDVGCWIMYTCICTVEPLYKDTLEMRTSPLIKTLCVVPTT